MKRMTIGADTDYFLPSDKEPKNFLELSDELLSMVEMARRQIAEADDIQTMQDVVHTINDVFVKDGLLGRTARVQSDSSVIVSRSLRRQADELAPVYGPEIVSGKQHEGVFLGCNAVPLKNNIPELAYIVELPLLAKKLTFRTVVAAVDGAALTVREASSTTQENAPDELAESFALLHDIDDKIVQKNLFFMADLMERSGQTNADFLKEMGIFATAMLARPLIFGNTPARNAISKIIASCVDEGAWYQFEGLSFAVAVEGKQRLVSVDEIEAVGQVHAATITEDFDYTYARGGKEASLTTKTTLQPAYVFLDSKNVQHVIPLRYLTLFVIDQFSPQEASCQAAREHFLEEYPDIFKEKEKENRWRKMARRGIDRFFK